jgi:type IV conjugative transfer system coupling protein TraD
MRNETLREGRKNLPLKHHSARGRPPRNSGNFTRGGQLASHEWMMFFGAVKIPASVWLVCVLAAYWILLSAVMGEHEIQLCSWRIGSWLWTAMDFNPFKPMNIVLADDSIRRVPIGYIPFVPDVQIAWTKAGRALIGALFGGSLVALPVAAALIRYFNRNGAAFMEERHERGAMLVERHLLVADILAHNRRAFEASARKLFPELSPNDVSAMPFKARKHAGLHHPYSLGGVPFPYGLEQSHTIIVGTTGSGKTTQLKCIVAEMRARGDSAVVFDLTGSFIESFYDPKTDIILNPGDERCPCWSVFEDCTSEAEFTAASQALIPHDGGGSDPFWVATARLLFVQMCMKLQQHGLTTNSALADNLVKADLKRLHRILKDTAAGVLTDPDAAKMATSIRSVYVANANALSSLPEDGEFFSIRDWVRRDDKPGSILFVSARYVDLALYKTMLTLWLDIAVNTLMTLPRTSQLRTWYMFDELGALHRLPAIENGLQTARGFGGAVVLGLHSFARLQAVYGREGAENMASLVGSKLILKTGDRKTAETCTEFIGYREVRQMDEAYSYGANSIRDAATLTPKKEIAPLVIPDDITNLPSLHGFVKFPDGFPAARVELKWRDYAQVAQAFVPRDMPPPRYSDDDWDARPVTPGPNPEDGGGSEGGGREAAADGDKAEREPILIRSEPAAETRRDARQRLAAMAALSLGSKSDEDRAIEGSKIVAEDNVQSEAQRDVEAARIEQNIDNMGLPVGRNRAQAGLVGKLGASNRQERQAAMQRELDLDVAFAVSPEHDHNIEAGD